jgi:ribosomal protein L11 methyltransferase
VENKLLAINIICPKTLAESVQGFLFEHVKWGWEETELNHEINFTVYFANTVRANEFTALIKSKFPPLKLKLQQEENQDWTENWKQFFTPIKILNKFIILPSWEKNNHPDLIPIYIEPKMAFGTGHHATTTLCLEAIVTIFDQGKIKSGQNFLDLGTGSGILGIACARLGLTGIGLDIDPVAIDNAQENIIQNKVEQKFKCIPGSIQQTNRGEKFDLILANILARPLINLAPQILSHLHTDSKLILSGILIEQEQEVVNAYKKLGLPEPQLRHKSEWSCLIWE